MEKNTTITEQTVKHTNDIENIMSECGNGKAKMISRCTDKRCKFDNKFTPRDKIFSTVTHRIYDCVIPPGTTNLITCSASNLIYLLTCNNCYFQYVGETACPLRQRFARHQFNINHPQKPSNCKLLTDHFTKGLCKDAQYSVQIIEKLEGNGRTERDVLDPTKSKLRKERELYWMLTLRTVYPYGLNDRIGNDFKTKK